MIRHSGKTHQSEKILHFIFWLSLLHHPIPSTADEPPTDTDDFREILLHTDSYVDKTLLIEEFALDKAPCKVILRPQRWGKTLNLNMLARFFELETYPNGTILPDDLRQNRKLFTGGEFDLGGNKTKVLKALKIASKADIMKLQGQYPVIYLSWKGINGSTYEELKCNMRTRVAELFAKFKYLNCSTKLHKTDLSYMRRFFVNEFYTSDIIRSISCLSSYLFKYFGKKVMLFVDDYDTPALNAYQQFYLSNSREYSAFIGLLRSTYVHTFHLNQFLENSLASGALPFSLLREVNFYSLHDAGYSQYYGFHQQELQDLLAKVSLTPDTENMKNWYGYKRNESSIVYNPGSIMRFIARNGSFEYSWIDLNRTGIDGVLLSTDLQPEIRNLSLGLSVTCLGNITYYWDNFNFRSRSTTPYFILLFSGIIAPVDGKFSTSDRHEMTAANLEIKHLLRFKVGSEWASQKMNLTLAERVSDCEFKSKQYPFNGTTSGPAPVDVPWNITKSSTATEMN